MKKERKFDSQKHDITMIKFYEKDDYIYYITDDRRIIRKKVSVSKSGKSYTFRFIESVTLRHTHKEYKEIMNMFNINDLYNEYIIKPELEREKRYYQESSLSWKKQLSKAKKTDKYDDTNYANTMGMI